MSANIGHCRGQTILIVDDDEAIREAARRLLEHAGYCVILAATGEDAIAAAQREADKIDVAVVDLSLADLSGPETLRAIREIVPEIRAFLWSGAAALAGDTTGAGLGDIQVLEKPVHLPGIAQVLASIVDASQDRVI